MTFLLRLSVPAVLLATLLCAGCASIDVEAQQWGVLDAAGYRSWAWGDVRSDHDDAPVERTRAAIERELGARGLQRVARSEAQLLVELDFSVQTALRERDPYFNTYPLERYEIGTLTIELLDAADAELLWSGTGQSELRVSGVPNSPFTSRLVPTGAARDWKIARKVPEILTQLPATFVAGASAVEG